MLAQNAHSNNPQDDMPVYFHRPFQRCPWCGALVHVLAHRITGKTTLIDMVFTADGDVLVNLTRGTYEHLTPDEQRIHGGWLHALHSNICPEVDEWQGRL